MTNCEDMFVKVEGVMIKQDFNMSIMSGFDVATYT